MDVKQESHRPVESAVLNRSEAARYLGIGERLLWSLTASKELPCCKIRSRVVYRRCDLDEYLAKLVSKGTRR